MSAPTAEDLLHQADVLLQLNRPAEAARTATGAVAEEPENARCWGFLGLCLEACGDHQGALAALNRAVGLEPSVAEWHLLASRTLSSLDRPRAAIDAAAEAVRLTPWESEAHAQLATVLATGGHAGRVFVYQLPGDLTRAERHAQRAIALSPDSESAHFAAALVASAAGRYRVARRRYRIVLRMNPTSAEAINNLAALDLHQMRLGRSGAGFVRALQTDPSLDLARRNVSKSVHLQLGCLQGVVWAAYLWFVIARMGDPLRSDAVRTRLVRVLLLIAGSIIVGVISLRRGNRSVRGFTSHLLRTRRTLWIAGALDGVLLGCLALGAGPSSTSIDALLVGLATMPPVALILALSGHRDAR